MAGGPTSARWEEVYPIEQGNVLQRIAVPGGWLYRTVVTGGVAMCFVPSPPPEAPQRGGSGGGNGGGNGGGE